MIAPFTPPSFTQQPANVPLKTFSDLRNSLAKVNGWIQYVTIYFQIQLLPPLNNNVVGIAAPLVRGPDPLERIEALEREVAALKERLNHV